MSSSCLFGAAVEAHAQADDTTAGAGSSCRSCHSVQPDENHGFSCGVCHGGDEHQQSKQRAHAGLVAAPASPEHMARRCGGCHEKTTRAAGSSSHFTLKRMVNATRRAFGAGHDLPSFRQVPVQEPPRQKIDLVDDLLRRRCLRCHAGTTGAGFTGTRRGVGCAGCHLSFVKGKLASHRFLRQPGDLQCLACHNGNRVGSDFHGMFEQDTTSEYRTPFVELGDPVSYGIETHRLEPDIHQRRGLVCIDCHRGAALHGGGTQEKLSCRSCHVEKGETPSHGGLVQQGERVVLAGAKSGADHVVPFLVHPAHGRYGAKIDCQVCHARWSFQDSGRSFLRHDAPDFEEWWFLGAQGLPELDAAIHGEGTGGVGMVDWLDGSERPGYWLKSYGARRWEDVPVIFDGTGRLRVARPSFDLSLSYVAADGEPVFENLRPSRSPMAPYTPHTTGRAGLFYQQRLQQAGIGYGKRQ